MLKIVSIASLLRFNAMTASVGSMEAEIAPTSQSIRCVLGGDDLF